MQSMTMRDIQKRRYNAAKLDGLLSKERGTTHRVPTHMDRINALEEKREIEAATKEVWDDE